MEEWLDGGMDGWRNGWIEEWMDGGMVGWMILPFPRFQLPPDFSRGMR